MVSILFFAQLREQLQCEKISLDISQVITLADLRQEIIKKNPSWAEFLGNGKILFAVNQTLVKSTQQIHDGDEVAFFPPVSGG